MSLQQLSPVCALEFLLKAGNIVKTGFCLHKYWTGGEQLDKLLLRKAFLGASLAAGRSGSITAVDYP